MSAGPTDAESVDPAQLGHAELVRLREAQNIRAREWAAEAGPELVGHPLETAETAAAAAGLPVKVVPTDGATTQEFGIGRITIVADARQVVTGIRAG